MRPLWGTYGYIQWRWFAHIRGTAGCQRERDDWDGVPPREEEDAEEEVRIVVDADFHPALRSRLLAFSHTRELLLLYVRLCI